MSGIYKGRLKWAMVISFFEGIFTISPQLMVMFTVYRIVTDTITEKDVWLVAGLLVLSVVLRAISRRLVDGLQSGTGYKIFANERMKVGDHLKRLPMGYFSEGAVGDVTAVVTSDIIFVEQFGMSTMSKIINGYISMILGSIMMLIFDWRIGVIAIITFILGARSLGNMDEVVIHHSKLRQNGMAKLTDAVIEYIRGISVIKAFNMSAKKSEKLNSEFKNFRDTSISFENNFSKTFVNFNNWFALGVGMVIMVACWLVLGYQIDKTFLLMIIIYIFEFFLPFQVLGTVAALVRIMEASLKRYENIMKEPIIDENGKDIKLNNFDVEFKNVSFAYENEKVLKNISFKVPERSMTALVGKSGCGKTTVTNLVARFWDVQEGEVLIGGVNVKEMTCDSLLKNISMVFQRVYLFNDTILNNIKFGKPDATKEEVIEACKKARCYDFVMALEKGFDTMIEEGGSSLSGGEKQRISIARAILKDAPIVLLDEATASVDPDNEKYIQEAINELVKEKTLIVIAHKLSTIRNAEQTIVMNDGEIVQTGVHKDLIKDEGMYNVFWQRRTKARSWKIQRV
jgi:ATP-binding cassette subfamily B protein